MNILQKSSTRNYTDKDQAKSIRLVFVFLSLALVATFCISVGVGTANINLWSVLLGKCSAESTDYRIFMYVRLPRTLGAMLCGAALSVAGIQTQAMLNNPMAAPHIIGVNSGAGLAAIICMAFFPQMYFSVQIGAFFGALLTCILIYTIAVKTGASRTTIILVGIAISSILTATINAIKTLFPDSVYNMTSFSVGGFSGISTTVIAYCAPLMIICFLWALFMAKDTDVIILGEETASALGMNINKMRFALMICASILAGCAVSMAGLVGFVGLTVPHIVRKFTGNNHSVLIPAGALCGAEFVLICDTLSRTLFSPYEIPAGILISFSGGIFFLLIILTKRRMHND